MAEITTLVADLGTLFTAVVGLAVTVTAFFIGRRWIRKI